MTGYYVLAAISVVWALVLTGIGLTRARFPATDGLARALMGFGVVLALVTMAVLVSSTHVEHPREEAAEAAEQEEAAEKDEARQELATGQPGSEKGGPEPSSKQIPVKETEFAIQIQGGTTLEPADYEFEVDNAGKIPHDLAVEAKGTEKKTPILDPGEKADLSVALKPGKYRFYCTVPGHAQSGMDEDVTVK